MALRRIWWPHVKIELRSTEDIAWHYCCPGSKCSFVSRTLPVVASSSELRSVQQWKPSAIGNHRQKLNDQSCAEPPPDLQQTIAKFKILAYTSGAFLVALTTEQHHRAV